MKQFPVLSVLSLALVAACGGSTINVTSSDCASSTTTADAAHESAVEATPDVLDASDSAEAAADTFVEATADAAPDIAPDAAFDTFETVDVADAAEATDTLDAAAEVALDAGSAEVSTPPKTGCAASTYSSGDPVLFACAADLPMTETSGKGPVPVAIFDLVQYSAAWNHDGKTCVHYIGKSFLNDIHDLMFVVIDVESATSLTGTIALGPDAKNGFAPWPSDGRICVPLGFALLAKSQSLIMVYAEFQTVVPGGQYQFELESPDAISLDYDKTEAVVGDFPVKSQVVTVVSEP